MGSVCFLTWMLLVLTVSVNCQNRPPSLVPGVPTFYELYENVTVGTEIFVLRATDADVNDTLTFSVSSVETGQLVSLRQTTFNNTSKEWTCGVILKIIMDYETNPYDRILYFNVNDKIYSFQFSIRIFLKDVNDNPPSFVDLPYRKSIAEDLKVGSQVFKVNATDPDTGKGSIIVYHMEPDIADNSLIFELHNNTGNIILNLPLDYERRTFYHYRISAKDEGNPPCPGTTCQCQSGSAEYCEKPLPVDLFITIIDVQDTPPVFEKLPYISEIAENKPVGSLVLTVSAYDGDRGVSQANKIIYAIVEDSVPFVINSTSGVISVGKTLDADDDDVKNKGSLYLFTVTATEISPNDSTTKPNPNNQTSTTVSITVIDVNDNPSLFKEPNYLATVLENTPSGVPITMNSSLIEVYDKDQGINSYFWIYLEKDGKPNLDFDTIPNQNSVIRGRSTVTIRVLNSTILDYETTKSITFKIIAQENNTEPNIANSSETNVILYIENVNDNSPQFPDQPVQFNVSEDVNIGHVIANITASDDDEGDFGHIVFSLEKDGHDEEFNITEWGQIQVAKQLDRELRYSYTLFVVATDSPLSSQNQRLRSTLRIGITVLDVNDHAPKWTQYQNSYNVLESAENGSKVAELKAIDLDLGDNAKIVYSISPGTNGSDYFNITTTMDSAVLTVGRSLENHVGINYLIVVAADMGTPSLNSSIELFIFVVDENQNPPVFIDPDQNASMTEIMVQEELPLKSEFFTFLAMDKDIDENGRVEYSLHHSTNKDYEYFTLSRDNGTLQSDRRLDRETKGTYEIQVRAQDNGRPARLTSSVTIRIILTDIDDNLPSYRNIPMPQTLSVVEEMNNAYIGQIKPAFDADIYPNNQSCYYLFGTGTSGFYLDKNNGSLFVTDKVDREVNSTLYAVIKADKCNLTNGFHTSINNNFELATDSIKKPPDAYNSSDESLLWVEITVDDINDNAPIFVYHEMTTGVVFDVDIGTEVISLASSITDKDTDINSKNMFKIVSTTSKLKGLSKQDISNALNISENGSIRTNIRFSTDLVDHILLRVMAYDKDGLNDTASVKVFIISNLQRILLVFTKPVNEIEKIKESFVKQLSEILNLDLFIDKIQSHVNSDGTRDPTRTQAYLHGRYRDTGNVVPASELWKMIDYNQEAKTFLYYIGVSDVQPVTDKVEVDEIGELKRIFAILIVVLGIIVIALILVLIHLVRLYRRRLRAATVPYTIPKEKEIFDHPGTNKYLAATNPLYGQEISHSGLDDKTSCNSLDVNEVDKSSSNAEPDVYVEPEEEQTMVFQFGDLNDANIPKDANYNSRLHQVLQAYHNEAYANDDHDHNNGNRNQSINFVNKGLHEGVTRFTDDNSGLSDRKSYLEHTDI